MQFSKLWAAKGKQMSEVFVGQELLSTAKGVVLDLGPGTGECLRLFTPDLITKAYGPEPAVDMHPALQKNINKAGLNGKYEILAAGAEPDSLIPALAKKGVFAVSGISSEGVFDTILCTRVLCGVPHTEETIQQLFRLLKPGGKMIVSEHVKSPWPRKGSFLGVFGFIMQKFLLLVGWNFWMGGCALNKKTFNMLIDAGGQGGWKDVDLRFARSWHPIPFVVGTLTKA